MHTSEETDAIIIGVTPQYIIDFVANNVTKYLLQIESGIGAALANTCIKPEKQAAVYRLPVFRMSC